MKLEDIFLLNEALSDNKALISKLMSSWSPSIPENEILDYVKFFEKYQDKLKPTVIGKVYNPETGQQEDKERPMVQVVKFLKRFPDFDEKNLRQIEKYSANQIKFLKSEFEKGPTNIEPDVFTTNPERNPKEPQKWDLTINNSKIEASKKLWEDSNNAIINEGGVRVFKITSNLESIKFGYYLTALSDIYKDYNLHVGQWCTTYTNENNAYLSYRTNHKRSFYFIIDDNKNPKKLAEEGDTTTIGGRLKQDYYLSALQIDSNGRYVLTPVSNGEPSVTLDYVLELYPQLRNHVDKIVYFPLDDSEKIVKSDKVILTEAEIGPPREFAFATHEQQLDYIINGGMLTKGKSWEYLDSEGKKEYMRRMNQNNYMALFSTYELLSKIEESISETKTFNFYLNQFKPNDTLTTLLGKSLINSGQFKIFRRSIENPNLELWVSANNENYGIYDKSKKDTSQFYKKDGIVYKPQYVLSDESYYEDEDGNGFWVKYFTLYRKDNNVNKKESFYIVTELDKQGQVPAHFYSYDNFQKLVKENTLEENPYGPGSTKIKKDMFGNKEDDKLDTPDNIEPEDSDDEIDGDTATTTTTTTSKPKRPGWSTADIDELFDLY